MSVHDGTSLWCFKSKFQRKPGSVVGRPEDLLHDGSLLRISIIVACDSFAATCTGSKYHETGNYVTNTLKSIQFIDSNSTWIPSSVLHASNTLLFSSGSSYSPFSTPWVGLQNVSTFHRRIKHLYIPQCFGTLLSFEC